jgi:hypothetical protein
MPAQVVQFGEPAVGVGGEFEIEFSGTVCQAVMSLQRT